jgi:hypothetical protein
MARRRRYAAALAPLAIVAVLAARSAKAGNAVAPPEAGSRAAPWSDYQIIMWQTKTAQQYAALRRLGVTAAKVQANRAGETVDGIAAKMEPLIETGLGCYIENIATDLYSPYHRWFADRPVNWKFLQVKRWLAAEPAGARAFIREPSLSDLLWLARIRRRLKVTVRAYAPYRPLFFNLADEAGIADLTAAWDFDFSKPSLDGFRAWLKRQYASLAVLNREWNTDFARWADVIPATTTEAMRRNDENYSSWSDFKAWMDVAFARAIRAGSAAVHASAPWARAGLEGVQLPGWGGYDYSRLAGAVDVMEMDSSDVSLALMRSLDPDLVILTTSFRSGAAEEHRVWHALLHGGRGLILWDPKNEFVGEDGAIGSRGRAAAPYFAELRHGLGPLLMRGHPHYDPIAILYSPASFRVQWMLDHRTDGPAWTRRSAEDENEDDAVRAAMRKALHDLEYLGFAPRFVTERQVERGVLQQAGYRLLVLPQTLALSRAAADRIRGFVAAGGWLAAAGEAGVFDSHGRRLAWPLLQDVLASSKRAVSLPSDERIARQALAHVAAQAGLRPQLRVMSPSSAASLTVQSYVFRYGAMTVLAFQNDAPAGGALPTKENVIVELLHAAYAYDVRQDRALGRVRRLNLAVGSGMPTVIVLAQRPLSARAWAGRTTSSPESP